jgi:hypothetical protein
MNQQPPNEDFIKMKFKKNESHFEGIPINGFQAYKVNNLAHDLGKSNGKNTNEIRKPKSLI